MNINYRRDTLYVILEENLNEESVNTVENRVDNIMDTFNIENLVINARKMSPVHFRQFEENFRSRHENKVVIK